MSLEAMRAIVEEQTQPKGLPRLVLLALASFANNKTLRCHPGFDSIAERATVTERYCKAIVKALADAGHVIITRKGKPGRGYSNNYQIVLGCQNPVVVTFGKGNQKGATTTPFPVNNSAYQAVNNPLTNGEKRVQSTTEKGATTTPESVKNQSEPFFNAVVSEEKGSVRGKGDLPSASPKGPTLPDEEKTTAAAASGFVQKLTEQVSSSKPRSQEGWAFPPSVDYMTDDQMIQFIQGNMHRLPEIRTKRFRVISVGGLVTRIEP